MALLLAMLASAHAHLMPAGRGTLNRVGAEVYLVVSLPVSAFATADPAIDPDHDGTIDANGLRKAGAALRSAFARSVSLAVDGRGAQWLTILPSLPGDAGHAPVPRARSPTPRARSYSWPSPGCRSIPRRMHGGSR
ncbi:MAG: hypothetical protein R3E48_09355 [Burkholderiaceae bacterium]